MALILASSSPIRRAMLSAAAVEFLVISPSIDEGDFKGDGRDPGEIALALAEAKALNVSAQRPGDWVIGSDSIVSVDGQRFDKPASRDDAAEHLRSFSGKSMRLTSAVALARGGSVDWHCVDSAELQVRTLSEAFIDDYLAAEWPEVAYCVGVFRFEGRGVQLFDRVEGSHFTILGMPLLPLLGALRERGMLPS